MIFLYIIAEDIHEIVSEINDHISDSSPKQTKAKRGNNKHFNSTNYRKSASNFTLFLNLLSLIHLQYHSTVYEAVTSSKAINCKNVLQGKKSKPLLMKKHKADATGKLKYIYR